MSSAMSIVRDSATRRVAISPRAMWIEGELVVPGPAGSRPAVLDAIRSAGGEILERGRLECGRADPRSQAGDEQGLLGRELRGKARAPRDLALECELRASGEA
mgnify:CR=1 FL=1